VVSPGLHRISRALLSPKPGLSQEAISATKL
jgi:hypothetical protein